MGTSLLIAVASLALAAPAEPPDGRLVLGAVEHSGRSGAVTREWAAVADPRTGEIRRRRLAGGTLCIAPVFARGGRVVFGGYRGRRPVTLALPLSLRGPERVLRRGLPRWGQRVPHVAWSPSGRWRYSFDGDGRLSARRAGTSTALAVPIDAGGRVVSIAVARRD